MAHAWVSGAGGFVGRHLALRLLAEGCRVTCLVRSGNPGVDELRAAGAVIVVGDLNQPEGFEESLRGVDWVFHLAAAYRDGGTRSESFRRVNVDATAALLQMSARAGIRRFIYCSTVGVHGDCRGRLLDEEAPFAPHEEYGRSKVSAEKLIRDRMPDLGFEVVIVRPVGVYGPGDWRLKKLFSGIARRRFVMIGKGRNRYQLTYVEDLVQAFWLTATVSSAAGQTYIIGGDDLPTTEELSREISRQLKVPLWPVRLPYGLVYLMALLCEGLCGPLGVSPPLFRRRLDFFSKSRCFDIGKARRELGFQARVPMEEGIRRTIEWYREKGILPKIPGS